MKILPAGRNVLHGSAARMSDDSEGTLRDHFIDFRNSRQHLGYLGEDFTYSGCDITGEGLIFDGTGSGYAQVYMGVVATTTWSTAFVVRPDGFGGSGFGRVYAVSDTLSTLYIRNSSPWWRWDHGANLCEITEQPTLGDTYACIMVQDEGTATLYVSRVGDADSKLAVSSSATISGSSAGLGYIGNRTTTDREWDGAIQLMVQDKSAWGGDRVRRFAQDPWAYVYGARNDGRALFLAATAGTAPTLSSPTATSITATGATLGCTVTF